jgi:hypothetical protein
MKFYTPFDEYNDPGRPHRRFTTVVIMVVAGAVVALAITLAFVTRDTAASSTAQPKKSGAQQT